MWQESGRGGGGGGEKKHAIATVLRRPDVRRAELPVQRKGRGGGELLDSRYFPLAYSIQRRICALILRTRASSACPGNLVDFLSRAFCPCTHIRDARAFVAAFLSAEGCVKSPAVDFSMRGGWSTTEKSDVLAHELNWEDGLAVYGMPVRWLVLAWYF